MLRSVKLIVLLWLHVTFKHHLKTSVFLEEYHASDCFYGTALWKNFTVTAIAKFKSYYHKCLKHFFGCLKYSSVTTMLFKLDLPLFDTVLHNYIVSFYMSLGTCENILVLRVNKVN